MEIEVEDPVTGNRIINLKAPHQYEYKGKAFYFESEESYERFKAHPEKYVGELKSRYLRVQGWQTDAVDRDVSSSTGGAVGASLLANRLVPSPFARSYGLNAHVLLDAEMASLPFPPPSS